MLRRRCTNEESNWLLCNNQRRLKFEEEVMLSLKKYTYYPFLLIQTFIQVDSFRKLFLKRAPFSIQGVELELADLDPAYETLDQFHHGVIDTVLEDGSSCQFDCLLKIQAEAKQLQVLSFFRISLISSDRNSKTYLSFMCLNISCLNVVQRS